MSTTVHVTNISSQTTEKEVRDFFSFCGKISSLNVTAGEEKTQKADVTFEKETAAKTALLLDNTQLGPAQVHVTGGTSGASANKSSDDDHHDDHVAQEDKPRTRIIAEYLAHGYALSDKVIEQAITFDQKNGYSNKFTNALKNFDQKYQATQKTQAADQKYAVSARATAGYQGLASYFDKVLDNPTGQKLRAFYETGQKQVLDVHNEARHLANLKGGNAQATPEKVDGTDRTKCSCSSDAGKCGCAPGQCACGSCAKNPEAKTSKVSPEEVNLRKVPGKTDRTECNCGADTGKCACAPGECACSSCAKNPEAQTGTAAKQVAAQ